MVGECCVDWGGVYVGAHVGYMWSDIASATVFGTIDIIPDIDHDAGVAGIHAGLQHQWGRLVLGVEAGRNNTFGGGNNLTPDLASGDILYGARVHNIVYIGPRVGWSMGAWMPYATGGYANGSVSTTAVNAATSQTILSSRERQGGWYIGGGVDWAVTSHLILGVEYRHYDFGEDVQIPSTPAGVVLPDNARFVDATSDSITARLSIKLGRTAQPLK